IDNYAEKKRKLYLKLTQILLKYRAINLENEFAKRYLYEGELRLTSASDDQVDEPQNEALVAHFVQKKLDVVAVLMEIEKVKYLCVNEGDPPPIYTKVSDVLELGPEVDKSAEALTTVLSMEIMSATPSEFAGYVTDIKNPEFQFISLSQALNKEQMAQLTTAMQKNNHLKSVQISSQSNENIAVVLDNLKAHPSIKVLSLSGFQFGERQLKAMQEYLEQTPSLQTLDISKCVFEGETANKLERIVRASRLTSFKINNSKQADGFLVSGADIFKERLPLESLTFEDLLESDDVENISKTNMFQVTEKIKQDHPMHHFSITFTEDTYTPEKMLPLPVDAVKSNVNESLTDLDFRETTFTSLDHISRLLLNYPCLERLSVQSACGLGSGFGNFSRFVSAVASHGHLTTLNLRDIYLGSSDTFILSELIASGKLEKVNLSSNDRFDRKNIERIISRTIENGASTQVVFARCISPDDWRNKVRPNFIKIHPEFDTQFFIEEGKILI
ncbi:hypothetical protein ACFL96_18255, partial [Thermoproteota archaeon]